MKLVFKFKDGLTYKTNHDAPFSIAGEGDLIERFYQGKKNNSTLTLTDKNGMTIEKRFSELHSFSIVMEED